MQYPISTDHHGIRSWDELACIVNKQCAYVLLAGGRASRERGLSMSMPAWGEDAQACFPNGVTITLLNRDVLILRPLGYRPQVAKPLSIAASLVTAEMLGIPPEGDFILYLGSGPPREDDLEKQCSSLALSIKLVPLDPLNSNG